MQNDCCDFRMANFDTLRTKGWRSAARTDTRCIAGVGIRIRITCPHLADEGVAQRRAHGHPLHAALHKLHRPRRLVGDHIARAQQRARQLPAAALFRIQDLRVPGPVSADWCVFSDWLWQNWTQLVCCSLLAMSW